LSFGRFDEMQWKTWSSMEYAPKMGLEKESERVISRMQESIIEERLEKCAESSKNTNSIYHSSLNIYKEKPLIYRLRRLQR